MNARMLKVLTAAAVLAAPATSACNRGTAEGATSAAPEFVLVERRDMDIRAEASGLIEPIKLVEVKSKASGEVLRIHGETGDEVERGALLAEVDPRDVKNAFDQAEADRQVAVARLETSEAQLARIQELRTARVATEQELESAKLDEANSRAQKVKAETNLMLARERLGDVTIRAPITGTIISRTVEEGGIIASASQNVSGGTVLMLMADLAEMQVRALVDETDLGRIKAGMPARVTVEAFPERAFEGYVLKIEPQAVVEQNVTMFPVLVRLDNRERLLKPGMNADVVFEVAQRTDVVAVPNAAIINPQDAVAAGAVLGLSEDAVNNALRGGGSRMAAAPAAEGSQGGEGRPGGAESPQGAQQGRSPECTELFQRMREAGGADALSEADRAKLRECRPAGARGRGGRQGGGGVGSPGGGEMNGRGRSSGENDVRPAVVFVAAGTGVEARRITIGLNDFDFTEVVNGLEAGDRVVLMSVARIHAQQQELLNRTRERAAGAFTGNPQMGGGGPRGGGGGGGGGRGR